MPENLRSYNWVAVDAEGKRKRGKTRAMSDAEVTAELAGKGLYPVSIKERSTSALDNMLSARTIKAKPDVVATFARQLHLMLRAGLSVPRAIEALGEEGDPRIMLMCKDIAEKTTAGMPLSEALASYPRVFDDIFCSYVAAGEAAGTLEESVARLAKTLQQSQKLRIKIKAVTAYPKMVSYAIGGMVLLIMMFLVPMYDGIYKGFGTELPAPTQIMVNISANLFPFRVETHMGVPPVWKRAGDPIWQSPINFISPSMWIGALVIGYKKWRKAHKDDLQIGANIERIKYRLPLVGKLTKYTALYRWSSTMAGALDAGLQFTTALELAGRTSGSYWIELVTRQAVAAVQSGRPLSSEVNKHPDLFFAQMRALIMTGEETGEPGEMFNHISNTLEDEIEALVATLGAKIEVALLMVMGAVVGAMLVVLYLPILNLSKAAGEGYSKGKDGGK